MYGDGLLLFLWVFVACGEIHAFSAINVLEVKLLLEASLSWPVMGTKTLRGCHDVEML